MLPLEPQPTYTIAYAAHGCFHRVMQYLVNFGNHPDHDIWTDHWGDRHIFDNPETAANVAHVLNLRYPARPIQVISHCQGQIGRAL
jgi:hypothetical protein